MNLIYSYFFLIRWRVCVISGGGIEFIRVLRGSVESGVARVREEENNAIINAIDFKSHGLSASAKPRRSPTREQDPYLLSIYLIFVQFPKDTAQVRKYIVYGYLLT